MRTISLPDEKDKIYYFRHPLSKHEKIYIVKINNKIIKFSIGCSICDGYIVDNCTGNIRPVWLYEDKEEHNFPQFEDILEFYNIPLLNDAYTSEEKAIGIAEYLEKYYPYNESDSYVKLKGWN